MGDVAQLDRKRWRSLVVRVSVDRLRPHPDAAALGFLLYLLNLGVSLLGAPAFAFGGRDAGPAGVAAPA